MKFHLINYWSSVVELCFMRNVLSWGTDVFDSTGDAPLWDQAFGNAAVGIRVQRHDGTGLDQQHSFISDLLSACSHLNKSKNRIKPIVHAVQCL